MSWKSAPPWSDPPAWKRTGCPCLDPGCVSGPLMTQRPITDRRNVGHDSRLRLRPSEVNAADVRSKFKRVDARTKLYPKWDWPVCIDPGMVSSAFHKGAAKVSNPLGPSRTKVLHVE